MLHPMYWSARNRTQSEDLHACVAEQGPSKAGTLNVILLLHAPSPCCYMPGHRLVCAYLDVLHFGVIPWVLAQPAQLHRRLLVGLLVFGGRLEKLSLVQSDIGVRGFRN